MLTVFLVGLPHQMPVRPTIVLAVVRWFGLFAFGVAYAAIVGEQT